MASMVPRWYENKQRKPKQNRCSNNEQFQMWIISLGILRRPFDSLLIFSLTLRARCSRIWLWWWWLCVLWIYECLNQRRRVFSLFLRLFVFSSSHRLAVWCFQFTEVIVNIIYLVHRKSSNGFHIFSILTRYNYFVLEFYFKIRHH